MAKFGKASTRRLQTLDPRLQLILQEAIKFFDFTIICGHRTKEEQNRAFAEGMSKLKWPNSHHNSIPSTAVDIAPWDPVNKTIDWKHRDRFIYLAAFIVGVAFKMGYKLRWGGDWDSDTLMNDQIFVDLPHLELVD